MQNTPFIKPSKVSQVCVIRDSMDNPDAAWYPVNSVIITDVMPMWCTPGGGRCYDMYSANLTEALDTCIGYAKERLQSAERHLKKLEEARRSI